ncbi:MULTISPECIES: YafY family protein [unclassified Curtobacterium]|uniref:helix-turn-helix transcriptional regulator n=1 Tax=unclassified Curtobacterium TaxID=257496 RepID=UPI000DA8F4CE|nr:MULTISPECIES: WYL domain-containing protein [unclassified Curtobacterium]PZE28916.1 transcriptional regulator [Curtobacterium sp. MCBD17_028]PZE73757.1 transcriptional regulator [Curtobacterium sp. MCBD17_019]PZF57576.1 transcriptional regulator [Curtobacterium sp. MCBD17_034]PZM33668.1 transcriptional regulator [Curtobacterium sp. MCBD17_031]WIE53391.1 WYL domain-containing protein [Curtobacterium sp. MCBD17_003]
MNRTDRLYAIVEELRAVAPRPRSAAWLADRFSVSRRTIERDVSALQQSGAAVWAEPGRTGGYCIDRARTLPPVNFGPDEAVAVAVALQALAGSPFRDAGAVALRKVLAAMRSDDADAARDLADRVHFLGAVPLDAAAPPALGHAVSARRVLRLRYTDRAGRATLRDVEPVGWIGAAGGWYLLGWCRLRDDLRAFRVDRIDGLTVTAETAPRRTVRPEEIAVPDGDLRTLTLV